MSRYIKSERNLTDVKCICPDLEKNVVFKSTLPSFLKDMFEMYGILVRKTAELFGSTLTVCNFDVPSGVQENSQKHESNIKERTLNRSLFFLPSETIKKT